MSRDNTIYFMNADFPLDDWAVILSEFDAQLRQLDDLDHKHCVTNKWSFDGVDGAIYMDLIRIVPDRHFAPPNCNWQIGLHCNGHRGIHHWFLYSIPLHAIALFDHAIFYDPHAPHHVAACDLSGIDKRMRSILPARCNPNDLVKRGLTVPDDPFWPCSLDRSSEAPATTATRQAMLDFCDEHDVQCTTDCASH